MSKAGIKGGRMWEHQPETHWDATVVQPHKKGEPGSDLPFKVKCVTNKCIVELFFSGLLFQNISPFQLQILILRSRSSYGAQREEGRSRGHCLKSLFLSNLLYYESKICHSSLPGVKVCCLRFCACEQCQVFWSESPASVPWYRC